MGSSHSHHNSSNSSPPRPSLGFRSATHPPVFNQLSQSQPESQRHLSLSQFNLDSRSFYQSQPSIQSQIYNPNAISFPLPATLRSSFRPPAIVLHSTPDLNDSLPSTPTSYGPPVPEKDSKFLPVCLHGLTHDSSDFNLAFNVPPLSHPSIQSFAPLVFEPEEPGVPAHLYPPTIEERSPRSRWRVLGGVGRLSSRGRDDIGIASGDSRMMSRLAPGPEVRQAPDRSESPVWEPGVNGAEGEMVWRAL
ncbi:hypothetical protein PHLCEN_2v5410 [Hermanssonia centrifuga]|uniref:Uncharacterized protein n=1 Tax=Hermanssonia centrifuga TaxID=98765 RepID=A0A2R6P5A4_9APHY|nr:hypothetical protein PHLCEN_2v5410 [Hermanssonia centrifuga]